MSFRRRLVLFLLATLVGVQLLAGLVGYAYVRHSVVEQATLEMNATAEVFNRQLDLISERVSDDVSVLSLDYALRKAVAEEDRATALSALRNHGSRVGATRMLLVDLDGQIDVDTAGQAAQGSAFPYSDLLASAVESGEGTSLAVLDGGVYWIVVVPVRAPVAIAFIAACVPVDSALLDKLRALSPVPRALALSTVNDSGAWTIVGKSQGFSSTVQMPSSGNLDINGTFVNTSTGAEHLVMTAAMDTAAGSRPVTVILDYPLEEVLASYSAVITPMLLVLAGALVLALCGAFFIAHSVSRPLEDLANATRHIAVGDYTPPPVLDRQDEIGALSAALNNMAVSIADREAALMGAVSSLQLARDEAVSANEAKSQFLSNMSHELRTPLNAIIGFAEMIHQQILGPVGVGRYVDYAGHIHDSGKNLLRQVEEMLALADSAAGKFHIARDPVHVEKLLVDIRKTLQPLADKAQVRLDVPQDAQWPVIEGDPQKLQQVLANLLHNAIKFTPRGGSVSVSGEADADMLKIRIADTGIGIAPEDLAIVVRPFHRRKQAFDGTHQGAGIGLPFAKAILELHGGGLALESVQGKGTIVTVLIPRKAPAEKMENAA